MQQQRLAALRKIHARKNNANLLDHVAEQDAAFFAKFHYDKQYVYQILFEDYQDQGEEMQKIKKPSELLQNADFWDAEKKNFEESRLVINKLGKLESYDVHGLQP